MHKYLIRFNTKHNGSELVWRVFENGVEHLVKNISIRVPVFTETSLEAGETKWNISCVGEMRIVDDVAYIVEKIDSVENIGSLDQYDDPVWQGKQFRSLGKPGIN